jgi:hypothetical protein
MCPPESISSFAPGAIAGNQQTPPPPDYIPSEPIFLAAYKLAATNLPPAILNHSLRVFLYAKHFLAHGTLTTLPYPPPVSQSPVKLSALFVACILHDLGASAVTDAFNGAQRFEVCGADAAVALMESFPDETTAEDRLDVWTSISIHTTPGIAERYSVMTRLVRLAVLTDFGRGDLVSTEMKADVEKNLPRIEIERVLGDAIVVQALAKEDDRARLMKAPGISWPWALVKSHTEDNKNGVVPLGGVNQAF